MVLKLLIRDFDKYNYGEYTRIIMGKINSNFRQFSKLDLATLTFSSIMTCVSKSIKILTKFLEESSIFYQILY